MVESVSHRLSVAVLLMLVLVSITGIAQADFNDGLTAYEKGDYPTALKEWRPLALKGDPHAQHMMGFLYAHGRGVAIDPKQTVKWWRQAADQGFAPAQYTLGSLYRKGLGVEHDLKKAVSWIGRAADAGYPDAQYALGIMNATGEGMESDLSSAYMWLSLAADTRGLDAEAFWRDLDKHLTPAQRLEAEQLKKEWDK
ncbi:MAG: sel1 repeat family protein [Rhodospirillaceae bacterium]|nr:sel1 repeat family protein [Rhodospirillaceae bacterium]